MSQTRPTTISPVEAQRRIEAGALLIDIRNRDEYARAHISCARNVPLSQIGRIDDAPEVIFHCRSGMRTAANAHVLAACTDAPAYLMDGGIDAWRKAGLHCNVNRRQPLEIIRQVQIAAGTMVLLGVLLGFWVSPAFFGLAAFVGAGLLLTGVTGWCGMASLLTLMPWNRRAPA